MPEGGRASIERLAWIVREAELRKKGKVKKGKCIESMVESDYVLLPLSSCMSSKSQTIKSLIYENPQPCLDPPNKNGKMAKARLLRWENVLLGWRLCSGVTRGCVYRIRLWPLRRDDYSGVLIGAGGRRRSDWPARV